MTDATQTTDTLAGWTPGDYAMHRDYPVRLEYEVSPGRWSVALIADYRQGVGITCGGYVSSYASDELAPISDPEMLLRVRAFEAQRRIIAAKSEIIEQERVFAAQEAGLRALQDANAALRLAKEGR